LAAPGGFAKSSCPNTLGADLSLGRLLLPFSPLRFAPSSLDRLFSYDFASILLSKFSLIPG